MKCLEQIRITQQTARLLEIAAIANLNLQSASLSMDHAFEGTSEGLMALLMKARTAGIPFVKLMVVCTKPKLSPLSLEKSQTAFELCPNLQQLLLGSNPSLELLNLAGQSYPQLQGLDFGSHHPSVKECALVSLFEKFPHLLSLSLDTEEKMTDKTLKSIARNCSQLTELYTEDDNATVTDQGFIFFAERCSRITKLTLARLAHCHHLAEAFTPKNFPRLHSLSLDKTPDITLRSLIAIGQNIRTLEEFRFCSTPDDGAIDNNYLAVIGLYYPNLWHLYLGYTSIDDTGLLLFPPTQCPNLKKLTLEGSYITDSGFFEFSGKPSGSRFSSA